MNKVDRRRFVSTAAALTSGAILFGRPAVAQQPGTTEPVFRISKNDVGRADATAAHPLDPALQIARDSLKHIRENIVDYTAIMIKRERIGNTLGEYEYMAAKVRNRKMVDGQVRVPFSVYLAFLSPAAVKGREVVYVENKNNGNIVAHEGGMRGRFLPTMELDPTGMLAMKGQRYPIYDLGIENLVLKLIEKGERDRRQDECDVEFRRGAKVGGRQCTMLTVTHPVSRPYFDFHVAEIFIDDELQVPVRYAAYTWPTVAGGERELLEEYTYQKVQINVGLTDADFDRSNKKYNF
ncbi:MAG: DUF1571 domain-containing protein [Pirellulaceae bacterium]|nr:DUF1571 domain-containing protein [Pirellulaceae bacterium]